MPDPKKPGHGPLSRFRPTEQSPLPAPPRTRLDEVGEVIESSTTSLVAEARRLHGAPAFGSFVRVDSEYSTIGIVFETTTRSIEPNRRPAAFGKTEEELRREQPQIFELLRTEFQVLLVGHLIEGVPLHVLPPQPAKIHSFVYACGNDLIRGITATDDYMRKILDAPKLSTDELLTAVLQQSVAARDGTREHLVRAGKDLARLLRDDYDRLSAILRRIA